MTDISDEKGSLAHVELTRLFEHKLFRKSQVLQRLLRFLVDAELRQEPVTEDILALGLRGLAEGSFHPYKNASIRGDTLLLRRRLSAYYRENTPGRVRFHLPQGSYRLRIDVIDPSQERWRRAFGQAKLLATSWYVDELELALKRIDEILAGQPGFAPAYALKSSTHLLIGSHGGSPTDQAILARNAAECAMALAPYAWESLTAGANIAALLDWDWPRAESLYGQAESIPGNEVVADPWYQAAQVAVNRIDECLAKMRQALIDYPMPPRNLQKIYGAMLYLARRWDEAEVEMTQTTEIYPDDFVAWMWRAMQALALGNHAEATQCLIQSVAVTRGRMPGTLLQSSRDFLLTGKLRLPQAHPGGAGECVKLLVSSATKRPGPAIDALERMVTSRNVLAVVYLRGPMQDYLHDSPRFLALFDRMGIPRPTKNTR